MFDSPPPPPSAAEIRMYTARQEKAYPQAMNTVLESLFDKELFKKLAKGKLARLFPAFSDRKAWKEAAERPENREFVAAILKDADKLLTSPVPELRFSDFRKFGINGNRTDYQDPYFRRRRELAALVIAECVTGDKAKYQAAVIDRCILMLEEWTWVLPAHQRWNGSVPQKYSMSDLFATETGVQLALLVHLLGDELDKDLPGLTENIRKITLSRTAWTSFVKETSELNFWYHDEIPNNWTCWCTFNNIFIALCLEQDRERLAAMVRAYLFPASRYVWHIPEHGFSAEGPGYYNASNGMIFRAISVLNRAVPGSAEKVFQDKKIRNMIEFIGALSAGKWFINYSDNGPLCGVSPDLMRNGAYLLNSPLLEQLSRLPVKKMPGGNCAGLQVTTSTLFAPQCSVQSAKKADDVSWFKNQFLVLRDNGIVSSLKAGHNAEPHNHNDLGHFTLYRNNTPIIIDLGTCTYTKKNFSPERYTLYYTRGSGHNAAVFGGKEQLYGKEYTASLPEPEKTKTGYRAVCDLSKAYPADAEIRKYIRTTELDGKTLIVTDVFELASVKSAEIHLYTIQKPVREKTGIRLGNTLLALENWTVDSIEPLNDPEMEKFWGKNPITKITLKTSKNTARMIFRPGKE